LKASFFSKIQNALTPNVASWKVFPNNIPKTITSARTGMLGVMRLAVVVADGDKVGIVANVLLDIVELLGGKKSKSVPVE
jgi:hypothetical protein